MQVFTYLFDVLLKQPQSEPLMQLDLLRMPLLFERPMVVQNLVYDGENMASTLAIIRSRVATWPALVVNTTTACVITLDTQNKIKYEIGIDLWLGK